MTSTPNLKDIILHLMDGFLHMVDGILRLLDSIFHIVDHFLLHFSRFQDSIHSFPHLQDIIQAILKCMPNILTLQNQLGCISLFLLEGIPLLLGSIQLQTLGSTLHLLDISLHQVLQETILSHQGHLSRRIEDNLRLQTEEMSQALIHGILLKVEEPILPVLFQPQDRVERNQLSKPGKGLSPLAQAVSSLPRLEGRKLRRGRKLTR